MMRPTIVARLPAVFVTSPVSAGMALVGSVLTYDVGQILPLRAPLTRNCPAAVGGVSGG